MFEEKLKLLFQSQKNLIWIHSYQEGEVLIRINNLVEQMDEAYDGILTWSITEGLCKLVNSGTNLIYKQLDEDALSLLDLRENIIDFSERDYVTSKTIFILKDFDVQLNSKDIAVRMLKDIEENPLLKYIPIIVISSTLDIPESLKGYFSVIEHETPNIESIIDTITSFCKYSNIIIDEEEIYKISKNFLGFYTKEILEMLNYSYCKYNTINLEVLKERKIETIIESGLFEYKEPTASLDNVGGNDVFKEWIEVAEASMTEEAAEFGVEKVKGYIAVGVPGSSKTYTAEALAGKWNVPFLRLKMSKITSRYSGETERNMDKALKVAQSCSPCILLIDEIEKALGGYVSSNASDAGAISRAFELLLDFLNNNKDVFVVMTSNNFEQLPPELTRSGRLDCIWYFSFPNKKEREEIFKIHLAKRNKTVSEMAINKIAIDTELYTGAEIENIVKNSINIAYIEKVKGISEGIINYDILSKAKEKVVPVSLSSIEKIKQLEAWSIGRALRANNFIEDKKEDNSNTNNKIYSKKDGLPIFTINRPNKN